MNGCTSQLQNKIINTSDIFLIDGRKPFPINHGHSSDDTFLEVGISRVLYHQNVIRPS